MIFSVVCWAVLGVAVAGDAELMRPNADVTHIDASHHLLFEMHWRRPVVRTGIYRSVLETFGRPAISRQHNLIIVGTGEGSVLALDLDDGNLRWQYNHGTPFETSATILHEVGYDDTVVLASRDGTLLALDVEHGTPRWRTTIDGDMRAPPRRAGNLLVVTTASNKVAVLQAHDGKVLWQQGRGVPTTLTVEGHARAAVDGDRVYATFADGYAQAFDLRTGSVLWARPLSLRGAGFLDADADPVVKDNKLYVASYSDGIYALNPQDGQTLWNKPAAAVTGLADGGNHLIASSADGYVWGLDFADGAPAFRAKLATGPTSRLLVHQGLIVLTAGQFGLIVLDATNGKPLQATAFGGRAGGDPEWIHDNLAFLTSSGYLYAWKAVVERSEP